MTNFADIYSGASPKFRARVKSAAIAKANADVYAESIIEHKRTFTPENTVELSDTDFLEFCRLDSDYISEYSKRYNNFVMARFNAILERGDISMEDVDALIDWIQHKLGI